jgi:16S rRNA (guanine966-N2)-methyltransferase
VIGGARFLDLFAGSGAVGLEAWSRGAERVVWVEGDGGVFRILKGNVTDLCGADAGRETLRCVRADVLGFVGSAADKFDVIFADPPYDKRRVRTGESIAERLLAAVLRRGLLAENGILILEQGADEPVPDAQGWQMIRDRRYGGSSLRFFVAGGEADDSADADEEIL